VLRNQHRRAIVPKDNPSSAGRIARGEIFALGIRDDQGLAFIREPVRLWASEHGPRGGDEINAMREGKNYGFPVIGYGHDYNGASINKDLERRRPAWSSRLLLDARHRAGGDQLSTAASCFRRGTWQSVRRRAGRQASRAPGAARRSRGW
jgi:glucose/arabinose dehydrogenase